MVKSRYLRRAYGDDQAATTAGVVKFLQEVVAKGDGVIVVPSIGNVKSTMLVTTLGEQLASRLIKDRSITVQGRTISLCSDATLKNFTRSKVYLALWSSKSLVQELEKLHAWESLVWVTWLPEEGDLWAAPTTF